MITSLFATQNKKRAVTEIHKIMFEVVGMWTFLLESNHCMSLCKFLSIHMLFMLKSLTTNCISKI